MIPPRRGSLDDARRILDEAAGALESIRDITENVDAAFGAPRRMAASTAASENVKREALDSARGELKRMAADLEASRSHAVALTEEIRRLREELAARPTEESLEEARAAGDSLATHRAAELRQQVVVLQERVSLLSAEHVRLEMLRRKAEAFGANSEAARVSLEETLRRDLRAAHAALDRAASESGTRDAKAVSEIEMMRKRLDQALGRLHRDDLARKEADAGAYAIKKDFEEAQAVIASLRRDLAEERTAALARERALEQKLHEQKRSSKGENYKDEFDSAQTVIASLHHELAQHQAAALTRERALELRLQELEKGLGETIPPAPPIPTADAEGAPVEYPPMGAALETSWGRLIHLLKPPLEAAYGHLRRLSAGKLSVGQRAILRLTGANLSQAADSLATIELALSDSPATAETATVVPVLTAALSVWEPVLRRRGIALARSIPASGVPESPHDPEQLRLVLHHVLRNAVEALPRGATVKVHVSKGPSDEVNIEFHDDGPGYPLAWLEQRFEPFTSPRPGHAGLGLAAVRRALLRWGGDVTATNAATGHGAWLTLTFAAATPRPASK